MLEKIINLQITLKHKEAVYFKQLFYAEKKLFLRF